MTARRPCQRRRKGHAPTAQRAQLHLWAPHFGSTDSGTAGAEWDACDARRSVDRPWTSIHAAAPRAHTPALLCGGAGPRQFELQPSALAVSRTVDHFSRQQFSLTPRPPSPPLPHTQPTPSPELFRTHSGPLIRPPSWNVSRQTPLQQTVVTARLVIVAVSRDQEPLCAQVSTARPSTTSARCYEHFCL
ncbi:hypothetical protein FGB62_210g012 [Gracilaria domingensis]|nr:hypothetical protein FGB62_210g012 [Gracilaria domingensis]